MTRKIERTAPVKKRPGTSSRDIISGIQDGTLTRLQFEAWHLQRRRPGKGFVIAMPDTPPVKRHDRKHRRGRR